jgi:hypothetical protein
VVQKNKFSTAQPEKFHENETQKAKTQNAITNSDEFTTNNGITLALAGSIIHRGVHNRQQACWGSLLVDKPL